MTINMGKSRECKKGEEYIRLIHLSDIHIGKRVNEFSMLEDQEYILKEILGIIDDEQPDGIIIAGDVYDKSVPSEEAVKLAFASSLIDLSGIHISPVYDSAQMAMMGEGLVIPYKLEDGKGQNRQGEGEAGGVGILVI